jgi:hypothetical protein
MKKTVKTVMLTTSSILGLLLIVLVVHIYMVTKPKVDSNTRVLARVDFKQDINEQDADVIYGWLTQQKGIDRVMCNTASNNVVFSYAPALANGNDIANNLSSDLHYKAERYMPDATDMQKGCPVSQTSASYRVYTFIKNIF